MNEQNFNLINSLIGKSYQQQGIQAMKQREGLVTTLLSQKKVPEIGWDDLSIKQFLNDISIMDSNNFLSKIGVGEREGRIWSGIVKERNFGLIHGIGRSGDISALQPKAAGSSLISKLLQNLITNFLIYLGIKSTKASLILPVATGMGILMTFLTLAEERPNAKYIIWPRIDQKTCLKSILAAGFTPLIV